MSKASELTKVGYVKDAHGIKGELHIQLQNPKPDWLESLEEAYLGKTPEDSKKYSVARVRNHKQGLIFQSQTIMDRNLAETFKGMSFYISKKILTAEVGETYFLQEILGFKVFNQSDILVGEIKAFSHNGGHELLHIEMEGKKYLLPFTDEHIIETDFENSKVKLVIAEGLLEVCLEP